MIDEYAQLQGPRTSLQDRSLRRPRPYVGPRARARPIEAQDALRGIPEGEFPVVVEEGDRGALLGTGRSQDVELHPARLLRIDLDVQFQGVSLDRRKDDVPVCGQPRWADVSVVGPQGGDRLDRLDAEPFVRPQSQPLGQRHQLVPIVAVLAVVEVEDVDDPALAVGHRRGSVYASGRHRAVVEAAVLIGREPGFALS